MFLKHSFPKSVKFPKAKSLLLTLTTRVMIVIIIIQAFSCILLYKTYFKIINTNNPLGFYGQLTELRRVLHEVRLHTSFTVLKEAAGKLCFSWFAEDNAHTVTIHWKELPSWIRHHAANNTLKQTQGQLGGRFEKTGGEKEPRERHSTKYAHRQQQTPGAAKK